MLHIIPQVMPAALGHEPKFQDHQYVCDYGPNLFIYNSCCYTSCSKIHLYIFSTSEVKGSMYMYNALCFNKRVWIIEVWIIKEEQHFVLFLHTIHLETRAQ